MQTQKIKSSGIRSRNKSLYRKKSFAYLIFYNPINAVLQHPLEQGGKLIFQKSK